MAVTRDPDSAAPDTPAWRARAAQAVRAAPVPSPCVNVCRIDEADARCVGCRRTLAEIAGWSTLDDAAKRAVWQQLPGREPGT